MAKRMRILLISCLTILVSVVLVVAGTFALFTDTVTLTHHLQAGTLKATLSRSELFYTKVDPETGYITTDKNVQKVSFDDETLQNVFGISEGELIVPTSKYQATLELSSDGNVAFGWWIEVLYKGETEQATKLDEQFYVTVEILDEEGNTESQTSLTLAQIKENGMLIGTETAPQGKLGKGETSETFRITLEFKDLGDENNLAQTIGAYFDVVIHAQQLTAQN